MMTDRKIAHAPRTTKLAQDVANMNSTCIGCTSCGGICQAMLEMMMLPDVVLNTSGARA